PMAHWRKQGPSKCGRTVAHSNLLETVGPGRCHWRMPSCRSNILPLCRETQSCRKLLETSASQLTASPPPEWFTSCGKCRLGRKELRHSRGWRDCGYVRNGPLARKCLSCSFLLPLEFGGVRQHAKTQIPLSFLYH